MKIAYVSVNDILNKNTWSKQHQGICAAGYYITKNLEDDSTSIDYISPLQKSFALLTRLKWSLYRNFFKKDYYGWAEPLVAKNYARQIEKKLILSDSNIVLCSENVVPISYLQCKQPIVLWTDATLSSLINFYHYMGNLCDENIKNIHGIEAEALNRCKLIIYTSEWAAQTAIHIYGIAPSKIKVVPWGANLECNRTSEDICEIVANKVASPCKLLFMGVEWVRKGGNIALEVAKQLNKVGLKTEVTIVGCHPIVDEPLPNFVKVLGFIDKKTKDGEQQINQLLTDSHFLILPSQAECFGHVFCEANSFGVPCISTNVGGITTVIKDDLNGKTFSLESSVTDYCEYIISLMDNYSDYKKLALSSFNQYQCRLAWNVAVDNAKQLMKEL
jgi:glycosyltransferase involved in cell wall biosynthesis